MLSSSSKALGATALLWAMAGVVQAGTVSGTLLDKAGQPLAAAQYPYVVLYQCTGQDFCTGFANASEVAPDGSYTMATDGLPAGEYQLVAGANDYGTKFSSHFQLAAEGSLSKALKLAPLKVAFSNFKSCTTLTDGWCELQYQVTNRATSELKTQVWAQVTSRTNMPWPDASYSSGNGNYKPMALTLAVGETRSVTQSVYLGARDVGAYSNVVFYASGVGQPDQTIGFNAGLSITQIAGGVEGLRASMPEQLARGAGRSLGQRANATRSALQAGSAAAPGHFIVGTLTAADTGEPLPTSLSPRMNLWLCWTPDEEFCSHDPGEFVYLGETGQYQLNTKQIPTGRYQFEAQGRGGYGIARSPAFDAPASGSSRIDLVLKKAPLTVTRVSGCEAVSVAEGGCTLTLDVSNTSGEDQTLWTWVYVDAYMAGSPLGVAGFTAGSSKTMKPSALTLKAGHSTTLQQPVTLSKHLQTGAEGGLRFYMGRKNDPSYVEAALTIGNFFVTAEGTLQRRALAAQ